MRFYEDKLPRRSEKDLNFYRLLKVSSIEWFNMKRIWPIIVLALSILLGRRDEAVASIGPCFWVEECAWNASDIVVATEGETIDGNFQVLEVVKGDLKVGSSISIPQLAAFAPETQRVVHPKFDEKEDKPAVHVTGSRMWLFLQRPSSFINPTIGSKHGMWLLDDGRWLFSIGRATDIVPNKPPESSVRWYSSSSYEDMNTSVVWVEQEKTYAFQLVSEIASTTRLANMSISEVELSSQVNDILQTQLALNATSALLPLPLRVQALCPFVSSKHYHASQIALKDMSECGKAALPTLRAMLKDEDLSRKRFSISTAITKAKGKSTRAELTSFIKAETTFWKQNAPKLQQGWWNGNGLQWSETESLQNHFGKDWVSLQKLKELKYVGCKQAVTHFRDFWRSMPQLEDKNGLDQMSEECDSVLKALEVTQIQP